MSVHAYRVIRIVRESCKSFSDYDKKLMDYLMATFGGDYPLRTDGCGMMEFHISVIKEAIERAKELGLDTDTLDALKDDVAETEKAGSEYIKYECY